jgi:hypothetical protein
MARVFDYVADRNGTQRGPEGVQPADAAGRNRGAAAADRQVLGLLAALVPRPRMHLTRYHGVFAPASPDRARIVPSTRAAASAERGEVSASDRQQAMS